MGMEIAGNGYSYGSGYNSYSAANADRAQKSEQAFIQKPNSTEEYLKGLREKYSDVNIYVESSINEKQWTNFSASHLGQGVGNNITISKKILEKMANDPETAAKYEKIIAGVPKVTQEWKDEMRPDAELIACGVVIGDDGKVGYWGAASSKEERENPGAVYKERVKKQLEEKQVEKKKQKAIEKKKAKEKKREEGRVAEAAEISISSEGMKSYRDSILQAEKDKLGNTDVMLTDHRLLISSKLPSDYSEPDANGEYHVINRSISERAGNLLKAYAEAYDEIQRGYADGTRETYVRDEKSEKGFRKLTKDEELAELDKAFEGLVQTFENRNSKKVIDALVANAEKISKMVTDRPTMAADNLPELKKRQEELSKLPENFGQSIVNAANTFRQLYSQAKPQGGDIAGLLDGISIFGDR